MTGVQTCALPIWGKFDYSQQEPRLTVHYGEKCNLRGAHEAGNKYREDSNADFHQMIADMTNIPRPQAKTINLGLAYGMGKIKLSNELGVTLEKASTILERYHSNAPFIRQLSNKCADKSMASGEIVTILGRKRRLQEGSHHKALNALIQGSAADMTKKAMLELHKEGIIPHIQVHDELDISVVDNTHAKHIKEIMEDAVSLEVPNKVDYECGPNWGTIK